MKRVIARATAWGLRMRRGASETLNALLLDARGDSDVVRLAGDALALRLSADGRACVVDALTRIGPVALSLDDWIELCRPPGQIRMAMVNKENGTVDLERAVEDGAC